MTRAFESPGPLEHMAAEERLEGVRRKLGDLASEAGKADAGEIQALLEGGPDGVAPAGDALRDVLSTRLMEIYRLHASKAAFSCLYELNAGHLYQQVASRLRRYRCRADALDILQEVFFNIYRYPHRFNCERSDAFRVWTATIVRNTVLKHMRSLSRSGRAEVALDDLLEPKDLNTREPARGVIENESAQECTRVYLNYLYLYLRFYRLLSEREQRAIQMVEVEGKSYREAAGELGIRLENLKMVIFRARRKIHRSMRRVFEGLPPDLRPARDPAGARRPLGTWKEKETETNTAAADERVSETTPDVVRGARGRAKKSQEQVQ